MIERLHVYVDRREIFAIFFQGHSSKIDLEELSLQLLLLLLFRVSLLQAT